MNNYKTISSLEIAEMTETSHAKLIRKLEGDNSHNGIIEILTEAQMGVSEYFIPDTYKDDSGKENKCYQFTKMGCDFIANKFNGVKGVLFSAKYVKRFNDMENQIKQLPPIEYLGAIASYNNSVIRVMKLQGSSPEKMAEQIELTCKSYGTPLIQNFVEPSYEQTAITQIKNQIPLFPEKIS